MPLSVDLMKSLKKEYGEVFTKALAVNADKSIDVISTGALSVDYNSGVGGIPRGRITEFYGPEASGKSTLCLYLVAHAQSDGLNVAYVDTEQSFDPEYAESCGVVFNKDSFLLFQPRLLEEGLKVVEDLIETTEFGLVVFDSAVGISPEKELKDELEDANVSLISRLLTKFCRRNIYTIRNTNTAMVFTNQVRDKIGAYIPTLETTGGHAIRHFSAMRIQTSRVRDIKEEQDIIGVEYRAVFKKNKVARPNRTAKFSIYFDKGIWLAEDVLTNALDYGIISMRGSYLVYNKETLCQGKAAGIQMLEDDLALRDKIASDLLATMNSVEERINENVSPTSD